MTMTSTPKTTETGCDGSRYYEYGFGAGSQSQCCHCSATPDIQINGFYLCPRCRDNAQFSHWTMHGISHTQLLIERVYYYNDSFPYETDVGY